MEESLLISMFGDSSRMRILDRFMEFPLDEFTLEELADSTDMSNATVLKEIKNLKEQEMINPASNANSLVFRINRKSPIFKIMQQMVILKSDSIADQQRVKDEVHEIVWESMTSTEDMEQWEKTLRAELAHTREELKMMRAT